MSPASRWSLKRLPLYLSPGACAAARAGGRARATRQSGRRERGRVANGDALSRARACETRAACMHGVACVLVRVLCLRVHCVRVRVLASVRAPHLFEEGVEVRRGGRLVAHADEHAPQLHARQRDVRVHLELLFVGRGGLLVRVVRHLPEDGSHDELVHARQAGEAVVPLAEHHQAGVRREELVADRRVAELLAAELQAGVAVLADAPRELDARLNARAGDLLHTPGADRHCNQHGVRARVRVIVSDRARALARKCLLRAARPHMHAHAHTNMHTRAQTHALLCAR